jgi:hypothetical protein
VGGVKRGGGERRKLVLALVCGLGATHERRVRRARHPDGRGDLERRGRHGPRVVYMKRAEGGNELVDRDVCASRGCAGFARPVGRGEGEFLVLEDGGGEDEAGFELQGVGMSGSGRVEGVRGAYNLRRN